MVVGDWLYNQPVRRQAVVKQGCAGLRGVRSMPDWLSRSHRACNTEWQLHLDCSCAM